MMRNQELRCGATGEAHQSLEDARASAVEARRRARDFICRVAWLWERFPEARLRKAEGLMKLVDRAEIRVHDWSLTPDRYVGVAPDDTDEDFDFEEALRAFHIDLRGLKEAAAEFVLQIAWNFEGLGT